MSRANQDVFLTTEELAQRWRTTSANVHMRRHRGEAPPAWRRGKSLLWRLADVEAYEAAQVAS